MDGSGTARTARGSIGEAEIRCAVRRRDTTWSALAKDSSGSPITLWISPILLVPRSWCTSGAPGESASHGSRTWVQGFVVHIDPLGAVDGRPRVTCQHHRHRLACVRGPNPP